MHQAMISFRFTDKFSVCSNGINRCEKSDDE
jgi:hypothetical protein